MNKEYDKFGGWLLVLFILNAITSITYISDLTSLLQMRESYNMLAAAYGGMINIGFYALIVADGACLGLTIAMLLQFLKREPVSVKRIISILIGRVAITVIAVAIFSITISSSIPGYSFMDAFDLTLLIPSIFWLLVWYLYFQKSERVKIYYRLDGSIEEPLV